MTNRSKVILPHLAAQRVGQRPDLIRALREAGFAGPFTGGKHQFLVRDDLRLVIPNSHSAEIGRALLARPLPQAAISREEWEKL